MTIYNGARVEEHTFVLSPAPVQACGYDLFFRDCMRSPWRLQGTYSSARQAENTARFLRARGNLTEVRPHRG
jgi:hypothetical protein